MQKKLHINFKRGIELTADGYEPIIPESGDFWRIYLDYCQPGKNRELAVYSSEQPLPQIVRNENTVTCIYPTLVAEDRTVHNIRLELNIAQDESGTLHYSARMINNSDVRLNELQYPLFTFERVVGPLEDDILYLSDGLGRRTKNPHLETQKAHTEYMAADYKNIVQMYKYPGQLSMPWMVLESGGKSLFVGAQSKVWRQISILTATEPREETEPYFMMGIASYPAVVPGENLCYDGFTVALFDGDWREGADLYRKWAENTWLTGFSKKESVRHLHGWQRIIMKHQYGEIYCKYEDLPDIFRAGKQYGIDMILLFAWWQEGMDNGYPNYQPDDALGGADKLREAIRQINEEGGRVVLYANGHLIDVATDFYKTEGYKYTTKDIDGNDYREHYMFSNSGTLLKMGNKSFVTGCYGTKEWPEKILEIEQRHLDLGSNGTFFDQLGCGFYLCFDKTHSHGNRIDEDPELRLPTVKKMKTLLNDEQWFGTEWVVDRMSPEMDFTHGFGYSIAYTDDAYPYIYRYTYPEIITSNRLIHDEKEGWEKHLNYTFVHGMMFDVAIYRCRASLQKAPAYGEHIKKLVALRNEYLDFMVGGKFDLPRETLSNHVWGAEYTHDNKTILAVWNDMSEDFIMPYGADAGAAVKPGEVRVLHV